MKIHINCVKKVLKQSNFIKSEKIGNFLKGKIVLMTNSLRSISYIYNSYSKLKSK